LHSVYHHRIISCFFVLGLNYGPFLKGNCPFACPDNSSSNKTEAKRIWFTK
jgi:hypothetical protein